MEACPIKSLKQDEVNLSVKIFMRAVGHENDSDMQKRLETFASDLVRNKTSRFYIMEKEDHYIASGALIFQGDSCWISFMGVLPQYQRKGYGTKLLQYLVKEAFRLNYKSIDLYATKQGEPLYLMSGFKILYSASLYSISYASPSSDKYKVSINSSFQPWIWNLDKKAIGYNRRLYLLSTFQSKGKIISIENHGFGLLNGDLLGPLIADDINVANEIAAYAYDQGARKILIPKHNKLPESFLTSIEMKEQEGSLNKRMTYSEVLSSHIEYVYAIRSFAGG